MQCMQYLSRAKKIESLTMCFKDKLWIIHGQLVDGEVRSEKLIFHIYKEKSIIWELLDELLIHARKTCTKFGGNIKDFQFFHL